MHKPCISLINCIMPYALCIMLACFSDELVNGQRARGMPGQKIIAYRLKSFIDWNLTRKMQEARGKRQKVGLFIISLKSIRFKKY